MNYEKIEVFNNKTAVVYYTKELKLLENIWLKKIALDSSSYREPFLNALEFAKQNPVVYFLSDLRNQGVVPVAEKKWFQEYIFPGAVKTGVKYASIVTTANVFKTYYMNALIKLGNVFKLPVKTFNDYDKAFSWLVNQNAHLQN